jgi:hypothetical protein
MSTKAQTEYCAVLRSAVRRLGKEPVDSTRARLAALVQRMHDRLARPPRILLLGEVNSGKSSLANLLIGESVVPTSVVANSRFPIRFHHAARPSLAAVLRDGTRQAMVWSDIEHLAHAPVARIEVGLPLKRLRTFEVIDTPGTASPYWDAHRFERQWSLANLPLWCTVAARAWKESERKAWWKLPKALQARGILVVTQIDLLSERKDIARVLGRLQAETAGQFRAIAALSMPEAIASSLIGSEARGDNLWRESGGAEFERLLTRGLTETAEHRVASAKRALQRVAMRERLGDRSRLARTGLDSEVALLASALDSDAVEVGITPDRALETASGLMASKELGR